MDHDAIWIEKCRCDVPKGNEFGFSCFYWRFYACQNQIKCAFDLTIGKFIEFFIQEKRVEVDSNKTKAILEIHH